MQQNYKDLLRAEMEQRCMANSRYSLRAFARDIGLAAPRLSAILNGKQGLSRKVAEEISKKLGHTVKERTVFCDLVEKEHGRSKIKRELAESRLAHDIELNQKPLNLDIFKVIADWHHFAILELTRLKGARSDSKWIAKTLGLNEKMIESAIERLIRLDLLERAEGGELKAKGHFSVCSADTPSEAIKTFHEQVMKLALSKLYIQPMNEREYSAVMMSFDSAKIEEAKEEIKKFRRNFSTRIKQGEEKDSLYCLSIQFFKLNEKGDRP